MPPKLMREIRRSADRWSLPVALHHSTVAGLEAGLAAGIRDLQHTVRDAPLTEAHLRAVVDGEVAMVPTLSVSWALAHERRGDPNWGRGGLPRIIAQRARLVAELFREFCEPRILASTLDFYRQFEDPDSYETWHLLPWPDPTAFTALLTVGLDNLRAWHRAGARLGCGNDGGVPLCFPGALALELRMLADAGLPAGDVLRMATADNARLLGLERTLGTVGQGKVADLLVLDDDPLEDPWHTYRPRMVFQSGRIVFWRDSAHRV